VGWLASNGLVSTNLEKPGWKTTFLVLWLPQTIAPVPAALWRVSAIHLFVITDK